jgi:hypothetical protein
VQPPQLRVSVEVVGAGIDIEYTSSALGLFERAEATVTSREELYVMISLDSRLPIRYVQLPFV